MKTTLPHWKSIKLSSALADRVAAVAGVYALVGLRRIHGLPMDIRLMYIGKSKNLRRRFREHADPWKEHNELLREEAMRGYLEFWFLPLPVDQIDWFEKKLINETDPLTNKLRYRSYSDETVRQQSE